jgi:hypothetical protein
MWVCAVVDAIMQPIVLLWRLVSIHSPRYGGLLYSRVLSENNVINTTRSAEGRLIDMDLRKKLNSIPSGASHRMGFMQFMAIELLRGKGQLSVRPQLIFLCVHMEMIVY